MKEWRDIYAQRTQLKLSFFPFLALELFLSLQFPLLQLQQPVLFLFFPGTQLPFHQQLEQQAVLFLREKQLAAFLQARASAHAAPGEPAQRLPALRRHGAPLCLRPPP